jgi:hypothetical protein
MEITRDDFLKMPVESKIVVLYDNQERLSKCVCSMEEALLKAYGSEAIKPGNDCFYLQAGKTKIKMPITRSTFKAIGYGTFIILLLTNQISISSPLVKDILTGIAKIIIGG